MLTKWGNWIGSNDRFERRCHKWTLLLIFSYVTEGWNCRLCTDEFTIEVFENFFGSTQAAKRKAMRDINKIDEETQR